MSPIYLCGPTASGKSALAVELAQRHDGEIINADAYQIYRGLEILSAAPSKEELASAPHHLFSIASTSANMDAQQHRERALASIADVQSRGKLPIVAGGSGMYLKFITHGPSPVPAGDDSLREQLDQRPLESLIRELQQLDPEGAAATNLKNRRYVTRALEICLLSGKPMSSIKNDWANTSAKIDASLRGAVLIWDREELRQRIKLRTRMMIEQGAIEEVQNLTDASDTCLKAIGVRDIQAHLRGEMTLDECEERIFFATCQYAKRQRTWFKKESWLKQIDISGESDIDELVSDLECALSL